MLDEANAKYPEWGNGFDMMWERGHQFSLVLKSGRINWDIVDQDNIVEAVAALAAHIIRASRAENEVDFDKEQCNIHTCCGDLQKDCLWGWIR